MTHKYTQREWDRVVGYGKVPEEYKMQDIYDTKAIRDQDGDDVIFLHNVARQFELNADMEQGKEMRRIADRFSELTKAAHNRKHWTGHE